MDEITTTAVVPQEIPFRQFNDIIRREAERRMLASGGNVFVTSASSDELFQAFLGGFPDADQQGFNCRACATFLVKYGNLVTIHHNTGITTSVFWDSADVPLYYQASVKALQEVVNRSIVVSPFYTNVMLLGDKSITPNSHFHAYAQGVSGGRNGTKSAGTNILESMEAFNTLSRALANVTLDEVNFILPYFKNDQRLKDRPSFTKQLTWLSEFKTQINSIYHQTLQDNMIWSVIAGGTMGQLTIGNSSLFTMIDNIRKGDSLDDAIGKFLSQTAPENHMRPTVAPKEGTVKVAEALFEKLNAGPSLPRRYARFDEIPEWHWLPKGTPRVAQTGLFGDLKTKNEASKPESAIINGGTMTLHRFENEVLFSASEVTLRIEPQNHYNFTTYTIATNADSTPILRWDSPEKRNTFSTYAYVNGSPMALWNQQGRLGIDAKVIGISYSAEDFNSPAKARHHMYALEGFRETRGARLDLFPSILRTEMFEVRSVIEAYANNNVLTGFEDGFAGIMFGVDHAISIYFTATVDGVKTRYLIDRVK